MKRDLFVLMFLLIGFNVHSQTNTFPSSGNVGIGTADPDVALKIVRGGTNPGWDYSSLNIVTNGPGNIYGPILYLNGASGTSGRNWGIVSSGALDAPATGAAGNFAIYDAGAGSRLVINSSGNVGIGTNNPTNGLLVTQGLITSQTAGTLNMGNNDAFNLFAGGNGYVNGARQSILWSQENLNLGRFGTEYNSTRAQVDFVWRDQYNGGASSIETMRLTAGGNLGIGTNDPRDYRLAVNGKIRAHEIKVEITNWPDYVFSKSYLLPTLKETEKYIKEKGHLPGIPSSEEVKTNGIDLGDMNAKLLQKIEELTLHLIEQNKRNDENQQKLKNQEMRNTEYEQKIKMLENRLNKIQSN